MRMMLREVAAGASVSYESISRDYSQSNYSSSRLALLEDRDNWMALQQWFIRAFREQLHNEWLMAAVMAGAIPEIDLVAYANAPEKFSAVAFKPRGWSYINPKEDVDAAISGIRAGLTTRTHEIARYGNGYDREDIDDMRRHELDAASDKDLSFTTDPETFDNTGKNQIDPTAAAPAAKAEGGEPPVPAREGMIINMRAGHAT